LAPNPGGGGFFVSNRWLGTLQLDGRPSVYAGEDEGLFLPQLVASILALRVAWEAEDGEGQRQRLAAYEPGSHKRVQALLLLKTAAGFAGPVVFSVRGLANKGLTQGYGDLVAATQRAGGNAQPWMFFAELRPGKLVERGSGSQRSTLYPVEAILPADLGQAYIGHEARNFVISKVAEISAWRTAWVAKAGVEEEGPEGILGEEPPLFKPPATVTTPAQRPVQECWEQAVTTQKYGLVTFRQLHAQGKEYGGKVIEYILAMEAKSPGAFEAGVYAAAQALESEWDVGPWDEEPTVVSHVPPVVPPPPPPVVSSVPVAPVAPAAFSAQPALAAKPTPAPALVAPKPVAPLSDNLAFKEAVNVKAKFLAQNGGPLSFGLPQKMHLQSGLAACIPASATDKAAGVAKFLGWLTDGQCTNTDQLSDALGLSLWQTLGMTLKGQQVAVPERAKTLVSAVWAIC
jgi:hypothetical protein